MYNEAVELRPWGDQFAIDDALYRKQVRYLLAHSPFYREKLRAAGFEGADAVGGLADLTKLPFTEKDQLRASRTEQNPIGAHFAVDYDRLTRIFSTSGTTGTPSYIPITPEDLSCWVETCARSYSAAGIRPGDKIVTTFNAGPFVAGATLEAFNHLGLCHIPVGTGNTERLMAAIQLLRPRIFSGTPSYALYLAEWAQARGIDPGASSIEQIITAGEPGGGEPAMRAKLEEAWGARVNEAMGIGDVSISIWGECTEQQGMHFSARDFIHFELINPESGEPVAINDGAQGELVLTHLQHQAAPLLRFRTRDHVVMSTGPCACGRTSPRVRCVGRTDEMLIVRGVNVFPSAVREVVAKYVPAVSGVLSIRPAVAGVRQLPPLRILVELGEAQSADSALAQRIQTDIRSALVFTSQIELVPFGSLPRSEYKSKMVDYVDAAERPIEPA
ncbi:MAG: AMP-binding protein [Sphingobium sp.]|nr:AMP-binding protein [Sphingobium sp.]